ncbi:hypothetical protein [Tsukamurella hominis]|uniref:hypothetical protein n=1 Tax=Tsukamurella hominis TaxID=1970232 RepID=UPI0039ECF876
MSNAPTNVIPLVRDDAAAAEVQIRRHIAHLRSLLDDLYDAPFDESSSTDLISVLVNDHPAYVQAYRALHPAS